MGRRATRPSVTQSAPLCDRTMGWPGVVFSGEEIVPTPCDEAGMVAFYPTFALEWVFEQNRCGNNHEGPIPFARAMDNKSEA